VRERTQPATHAESLSMHSRCRPRPRQPTPSWNACTGSMEWKRMGIKTAVKQGILVEFTDAEMQCALRLNSASRIPSSANRKEAAGSSILKKSRQCLRRACAMCHRLSAANLPRPSCICGCRQQNIPTRLCECGLNWSLEFIDGCEVGHHHAKRLGLIHTAENLPADSLQLIGNLVGQREDERGVNALKRNVQPRAL
jgi:hypothetical protein